jgi:Ca2+-binding EF-hand superfamily protein
MGASSYSRGGATDHQAASSGFKASSSNYQVDNNRQSSYSSPPRSSHMGASSTSYGKKSSPLRPRDEDQLFAAFRELLLLERELERAKVDLTESCSDFNLYDAFKILDRGTKGWIQSFDLRDAMVDQRGIDLPDFSLEDIELFMARYDRDSDRKLRFSEFCDAFTPLNKMHADMLNRRSSQGYVGQLTEKTLMMYRSVWMTHQRIEQRAEHLRHKLSQSPTFSIYDAFQRVDVNGDGKITPFEFRNVIEMYGFPCSQVEVDQLVARFDKNGDGVISYLEFSDEMRPHSPKRR